MNWYPQSPSHLTWSGSDKVNQAQYDISPSEALSLSKTNVLLLCSVLVDSTFIDSPKPIKNKLTEDDYDIVYKCISESIKALRTLALEFNVSTPNCLTPLMLKAEIPMPQNKNCNVNVPNFSEYKHEINPYLMEKKYEADVDDSCLALGTIFNTLEEASSVFENYAVKCGFNICKGNSKRDVYQEFACSARGKVRVRKVQDQSKQRNRKSIKQMCKCHIILRKKEGFWVVTTRNLSHTHILLSSEQIKKTAKNRFIPEEYKMQAIELYQQGEAPAKIQFEFETQLQEKCTWSMKDLYNMLYRYKPNN